MSKANSSKRNVGKAHAVNSPNDFRSAVEAILASAKGPVEFEPGMVWANGVLHISDRRGVISEIQMCAEDEGRHGAEPLEWVKAAVAKAEKAQAKLHNVEQFDTGYGIAIDDDGNLFQIQADPRSGETDGFPNELWSIEPMTIRESLEWLTMMHGVDGVGSSPDYERFFKLIASKLPEGV